jgi:tetratricopeptide (TPR) repeat protein
VAVLGALTERQLGFWKDSAALFRHTLEVTENNSIAQLNVGAALIRERKYAEATAHFEEALRIRPGYPAAESNLGFLLTVQGQYDEAILHYRMALARHPESRKIHYLIGNALMGKGDRSGAMTEYRTELEINPNNSLALNDVAWRLATDSEPAQRNGMEAVKLAERLCRVTGFHEAQSIGTLAAAYAEAGRFEDAIKAAEKAKSLAVATGQKELAERNDQLLQLYREGKPYHEEGR